MFLVDLAGDGRSMSRAVVDLAFGAVRVRLLPRGMPRTVPAWRDRTRASRDRTRASRDRTRASIAWATVPALAGLLLSSVIMQHSFQNSMQSVSSTPLSTGGRVAADAMSVVRLVSVLLALCLLVGWALVGRLADRAPRGRAGRRWLLLVTAPLAGGAIEIVLSVLRARLAPQTVMIHLGSRLETLAEGGHPLVASLLSITWDVVAVAWLFSVFCVVLAARRADLQVTDLRGGVWLAQFAASVMVVVAVAAIAWGIGVTHQPLIPRADLIGFGPGIRPWTGIQTSVGAGHFSRARGGLFRHRLGRDHGPPQLQGGSRAGPARRLRLWRCRLRWRA
jgi:hypothetical protein